MGLWTRSTTFRSQLFWHAWKFQMKRQLNSGLIFSTTSPIPPLFWDFVETCLGLSKGRLRHDASAGRRELGAHWPDPDAM